MSPAAFSMHENHHTRPYGVGLAYRYLIHQDLLRCKDQVDLLELSTEDYLVHQRRVQSDPKETLLEEALTTFPCVAHGLSLSIGSVEPLDRGYLLGTQRFLDKHQLTVFSEHLAFHRFQDRDLTMFLELPFDEASVAWTKANYERVRAILGRPFGLENVTYPFPDPKAAMSEAEFFRRVSEETDGSFLFDVTNLYNNSQNHGYDPYVFLDQYPLDRVVQLHLAGGFYTGDRWEDSHSHAVMESVWELYAEVLRRTRAEIVIVERDSRFQPFAEVMEDVNRARELFFRHRPESPDWETPHRVFEPETAEPWDAGSSDPQFAGLRGYQEAVMGRITNPEFRADFHADPEAALSSIALPPEWAERVQSCDKAAMTRLEDSWDGLSQMYREEEKEFEDAEWAAWAKQLQTEPS